MTEISGQARMMMRSALGLKNGNRTAYRNRFFLPKDTPDWVIWAGLVQKGLAVHIAPSREGRFHLFAVTTEGFKAVRLAGENPDAEEEAAMREYDKHPSVGTDITLATEPTA